MDKLLQCRQKIDEIDTKIIELFEARMDVIKDVVAYNIANNIRCSMIREARCLKKFKKIHEIYFILSKYSLSFYLQVAKCKS